jgi:hypothetical protein
MGSIYTTITRNETTSITLEIMTPTIPASFVGSIYTTMIKNEITSITQGIMTETMLSVTESYHHIPLDLQLPSYGHLRPASRLLHSYLQASGFTTT